MDCEVQIKYHDIGNRWTFISASASKDSVNTIIRGVGMLLSLRAIKSLITPRKYCKVILSS